VSRAFRNFRHRVQRLQEMECASVSSGSPGRSPRTLRPERLHWLSKPGKARCRADWTQGSVRSLQLRPSHLPADRRTVPWAQIAASLTVWPSLGEADISLLGQPRGPAWPVAPQPCGKGPSGLPGFTPTPSLHHHSHACRLEAKAGTSPPSSHPPPPRGPP
jgi:hypothetical protein